MVELEPSYGEEINLLQVPGPIYSETGQKPSTTIVLKTEFGDDRTFASRRKAGT